MTIELNAERVPAQEADQVVPGGGAPRERLATGATVAGLIVVGAVIPVLLARQYGALDIPRSDAWSYLHTLFEWNRNGHLDFNNWVSMTLIGQLVLALPVLAVFGRSVLAVNLAFAGLGIIGLLCVLRFGKLFGLSRTQSAFIALLIAACPMWGALAPTFMTDVPAFTVEIIALALACAAFRRASTSLPLLGASVAVGVFGVSIRQYGAIPLIAVFAAALWQFAATRDRRRLRFLLILGVVAGIAILALLAWWRTVPHALQLAPGIPTTSTLKKAYLDGAGFLRLAGFMLAPAVLLIRPVDLVRRAFRIDRKLSFWVLGVGGFILLTGYVPKRPFVGNYFARRGVLGDDIALPGVRPNIMPPLAFDVLVVIGTVSALVLLFAMVPWLSEIIADVRARRWRTPDPRFSVLAFTVGGFAVCYELAIATGLPIFDRYALPALPLVAMLLLRSATRRAESDATLATPPPEPLSSSTRASRSLAVGALVVIGLIGIAFTAESASYDGTRWKLAEIAVDKGYTHVQVDSGYEWIGWYRGSGPDIVDGAAARKKAREKFYRGLCVSVLVDAKKLPPHVIAIAYSHALTRKPSLFVAYLDKQQCSTAPDSNGP